MQVLGGVAISPPEGLCEKQKNKNKKQKKEKMTWGAIRTFLFESWL